MLPPSYHGYTGTFALTKTTEAGGWTCRGAFAYAEGRVEVTELPLGTSTFAYEADLRALEAKKLVADVANASQTNRPRFSFSWLGAAPPTLAALKLVTAKVPANYTFLHDGCAARAAARADAAPAA